MKNIVIILGVLFSTYLYSQEDPFKFRMDSSWAQLKKDTFSNLLAENKLLFSIPNGFTTIKVKENYNVFYQYAISDTNSNFEIRFFIKSLKNLLKDTVTFNPNNFSYNFLGSMALNASGNILPDIPQIDLFSKEAVKNEFNANWGGTTAFNPKTEFGKGFSFCALNCLRLDNVCEVYIFYMFDDLPNQRHLMQDGFYVMKFKK